MVDPIAEQRGEQQRLRNDLQIPQELTRSRNRRVDESFERSRRRAKRPQNSQGDQHPPHQEPPVLAAKQTVSEWVENRGKKNSTENLQGWPQHNQRTGRGPHSGIRLVDEVRVMQEMKSQSAHQEVRECMADHGLGRERQEARLLIQHKQALIPLEAGRILAPLPPHRNRRGCPAIPSPTKHTGRLAASTKMSGKRLTRDLCDSLP